MPLLLEPETSRAAIKMPKTRRFEAHYEREANLGIVILHTCEQEPISHNLGDVYVNFKDTMKKLPKMECFQDC